MSGFSLDQIPTLTGKTVLITGGTHGLGLATIAELAKHQPHTICFTGRNEEAAGRIQDQVNTIDKDIKVFFVKSDHTELATVQAATEKIKALLTRLDILILNAGVMGRDAALLKDHPVEQQFGINHLAHALMIRLLLPLLRSTADKQGDARVLIMSSTYPFNPSQGVVFDTLHTTQDWWVLGRWTRYGQSKLANAAYAMSLAEKEPKISCISLHPAIVATGLWDHKLNLFDKLFMKAIEVTMSEPIDKAILNICWAATAPRSDLQDGAFYEHPLQPGVHSKIAADDDLRRKLWDWTEKQLDSREIGHVST